MRQIISPREIYYGPGALQKLATLEGRAKEVLVVTDPMLVKFGLAKKVTDVPNSVGIKNAVYDGVTPDPTRSCVNNGLKFIKDNGMNPDWIIGLGGGSSIDTGKAIRLFSEVPDADWTQISLPIGNVPKLGKINFIGISTTSGTGSEVSQASVITNDTIEPHVKDNVLSQYLIPQMAISDPDLAMGMPPKVTAATGVDALIHAWEAYTSRFVDDYSSAIGLQAIKMIYKNLPIAYQDGSNLEARDQVHSAQMFASLSFTIAGLGIAHALGLQFGAFYGLSHGISCGIPMPYVIKYNGKVNGEQCVKIADVIGVKVSGPEDAGDKLAQAFYDLEKELGLPLSIKEVGVSEEQFEKDLPVMADLLIKYCGSLIDSNARDMNYDECIALLKDCYNGVL